MDHNVQYTHISMQERRTRTIYKLYNKNFIALQLNKEHIRNELCHYRGPLHSAEWRHRHAVASTSCFPIPSDRYWSTCPLRGDVTDRDPLCLRSPLVCRSLWRSAPIPVVGPGLVISEAPLVLSGPAPLGRGWLVVWSAGPSRLVTRLWMATIPWQSARPKSARWSWPTRSWLVSVAAPLFVQVRPLVLPS